MNKINNVISRIIIALVLAVLISNIARCQMVDNWQKNNASRDSINLSMDAKPLTYVPNYEFDPSLDEFYYVVKSDSSAEIIYSRHLPLTLVGEDITIDLNLLDEIYYMMHSDGRKDTINVNNIITEYSPIRIEYDPLMERIEQLQRELNFLGSEYQDLIIKIHELRIENDRLYHKIENLNKMVYKLYR